MNFRLRESRRLREMCATKYHHVTGLSTELIFEHISYTSHFLRCFNVFMYRAKYTVNSASRNLVTYIFIGNPRTLSREVYLRGLVSEFLACWWIDVPVFLYLLFWGRNDASNCHLPSQYQKEGIFFFFFTITSRSWSQYFFRYCLCSSVGLRATHRKKVFTTTSFLNNMSY